MFSDMRTRTAMQSIRRMIADGQMPISDDDKDFLLGTVLWGRNGRTRARRLLEDCIYASLDEIGLPRFDIPAEFVAASIWTYVSSVNWMVACDAMSGCSWSDDLLAGSAEGVEPQILYALLLAIDAGDWTKTDLADDRIRSRLGVDGKGDLDSKQ